MTFTFRPAKRENMALLLGLAGGTGSGKTMSALRLARGIANGQPFAFVDTENGRANHYADVFPEMQHGDIAAPFRPEKYADAIEAADKQGFPVIVVDSMSHEWAGDGGCLDWQEEIMRGEESRRLMSWIEPKKAHKRMATRLLQVRAHVILCFRAEPKVEMVKNGRGQWEFVPKVSLTGLGGWLPISEKMLPYELTASFLLMADTPGVPKPIKLQEQHKPFVPLDQPITEQTGAALAGWAAGGADSRIAEIDAMTVELTGKLLGLGQEPAVALVAKHRAAHDLAGHAEWLRAQILRADARISEGEGTGVGSAAVEPEPSPSEEAPRFKAPQLRGRAS